MNKDIEHIYIGMSELGLEISDRPDDAQLGKWLRNLYRLIVKQQKGVDPYADKIIDQVSEQRQIWVNKKNLYKKNSKSAPEYTQSAREEEIPEIAADAEPGAPAVEQKLTEDALNFDAFRRSFGGVKRGLDSEFKNFVRKHKDWKAALPLLMPALEKERAWRQRCADVGAFCPEWPMMSTWINQRRWEQELSDPAPQAPKKTARQLENEKNERETAEWIQSLGKEKNAEPKGFLDDLSRDILGGMKNGQ